MNAKLSVADGSGMVKKRLSALTWSLHNYLLCEVFDDGTKEVIENCRVVCGLKSLLVKIYQKGNVMVGLEETKKILNAVGNITGSAGTVNDGDLINHYRMFVAHLETLFIKSCKTFDPSILDSKEIIQSNLRKENIALFSNGMLCKYYINARLYSSLIISY